METFSVLLALCAWGGSTMQSPVDSLTKTIDAELFFWRGCFLLISFGLLNGWGNNRDRWFHTPLCTLWRHCNEDVLSDIETRRMKRDHQCRYTIAACLFYTNHYNNETNFGVFVRQYLDINLQTPLFHIIACRLWGTRPLSESILVSW